MKVVELLVKATFYTQLPCLVLNLRNLRNLRMFFFTPRAQRT
jgi:hypothetical protein